MPKSEDTSSEQIAILLKVSQDELPVLERKHGLPRMKSNKYDLLRVVHWYIDRSTRLLAEEKAKRNIRNLPDVAYMLKVDPRTINKLAKERGLPRDSHGIYDIVRVVQWLVDDYERQLKDVRHGAETEGQARKRLFSINADLKQIELSAKRGQVANIEDVRELLTTVLKALRDKILALPKRAAPQIVALETIAEIELLLESIVHESLDGLVELPQGLTRLRKLAAERYSGDTSDLEASEPIAGPKGRKKKLARRSKK